MSTEALKQLYFRVAAAVNTRRLDLLADIYHPELINHGADPDEPRGAYHFQTVFADLISACPNLRVQIDDQIAERDKVVVRWTDIGTHTGTPLLGVPATGKEIVLTGIDILRIADGKVVERWAESDMLYVRETLDLL